jgi:hypothetical protein
MAKKGLKEWLDEKWVDIGSKRKDGSYAPCGRSKGEKRKGYPKCVPLAKARSMSEGQRRSAVTRKRAASNTGPKPTNVSTFVKKANGGMISAGATLDKRKKVITKANTMLMKDGLIKGKPKLALRGF